MITRKQAIQDCKKIWELVLNGKAKNKFEAIGLLPELKRKYASTDCPFCEYAGEQFDMNKNKDLITCEYCPFYNHYGFNCGTTGTHYRINPKEFAALVMKLDENE